MSDKLIIKVPKIRDTGGTVVIRTTGIAQALIVEAARKTGMSQSKMAETLIRFAFERLEIQEED